MFWVRTKKSIFSYTLLSGVLGQVKQNVGPDLDLKPFDTLIVILKVHFEKKQTIKCMINYPACKDVRTRLKIITKMVLCFTRQFDMIPLFLAHGIRTSEILPWDRKSYLTHAILPK